MKSLAPRLLLSLGDGSAPAARAAAQLSRLRELPHISLPLAEAAALPPFALAWVGRLPFDALLRWNAAPLTIAMLISRGAASAARALDALGAAVFFGDAVRLKLHVHADAPRDALALAQRWEWPPAARAGAAAAAAGAGSRKQVRYGIGRAEFDLKAAAAQTSLVGNAWLPTADDEVVVVLDDGAELSPYFYAVLKHFLLTADRAHLLGVAFGLPEAPPPDAPHDAAADAAAKAAAAARPRSRRRARARRRTSQSRGSSSTSLSPTPRRPQATEAAAAAGGRRTSRSSWARAATGCTTPAPCSAAAPTTRARRRSPGRARWSKRVRVDR